MIKRLLLILLVAGFGYSSYAQESKLNKNFGIGLQIGQVQKDFGIGLSATSAYFGNGSFAVRARANLLWLEHLDTNNEFTWTPYSNVSLSFISVAGELSGFARLYAEGGILVVLPSDTFSSENVEAGGFGVFGFEFFMSPNANYFLELGGAGTGAGADKVAGDPIYSNGLYLSAGFRYQF